MGIISWCYKGHFKKAMLDILDLQLIEFRKHVDRNFRDDVLSDD
jgi:hypothetical protein